MNCSQTFTNFAELLNYGTCILSRSVIPLLITAAFVVFFIGVIRFISNADDPTKRAEGQQYMLWGILALFVMLSIWGILTLLSNTFQIGVGGTVGAPSFGP